MCSRQWTISHLWVVNQGDLVGLLCWTSTTLLDIRLVLRVEGGGARTKCSQEVEAHNADG